MAGYLSKSSVYPLPSVLFLRLLNTGNGVQCVQVRLRTQRIGTLSSFVFQKQHDGTIAYRYCHVLLSTRSVAYSPVKDMASSQIWFLWISPTASVSQMGGLICVLPSLHVASSPAMRHVDICSHVPPASCRQCPVLRSRRSTLLFFPLLGSRSYTIQDPRLLH